MTPTKNGFRCAIPGVAACAFFCVVAGAVPAQAKDQLYLRDIGCDSGFSGRSKQICDAIAGEMQWSWFENDTHTPGFRPTPAGLAQVYCDLHMSAADKRPLQTLIDDLNYGIPDHRLEGGARWLLRLADPVGEPEISPFNPNSHNYFLKGICR